MFAKLRYRRRIINLTFSSGFCGACGEEQKNRDRNLGLKNAKEWCSGSFGTQMVQSNALVALRMVSPVSITVEYLIGSKC